MNYIVNGKQMFEAEKRAVNRSISFTELMEHAGTACAEIINNEYCSESRKNILILCGKGKNGGDGFVIARILKDLGNSVKVALVCSEPTEGDQLLNYNKLRDCGISAENVTDNSDALLNLIDNCDLIIDAVFGTGFRGSLNEFFSFAAKTANSSGKPIVSIDVPSGVNCDTCETEGEVFEADTTITISAYKPVHIYKPFSDVCGRVLTADIGITIEDYSSVPECVNITYNEKDIKTLLPKRFSDSNKGTYGKAICICGSYKMPGAAYMSVSGALRMGAGLVTSCFPESAYTPLSSKLNEAVLLPVSETKEGTFSYSALSDIISIINNQNAVLLGCGIGLNTETKAFTEGIIKCCKVPLVLDADALNAVSEDPDMLKCAEAPIIITPHPGEMSRLCGKTIEDILSDPVSAARKFSDEYGCTVVLKTANTVVCSPDNKYTYINNTGNSGLSKGGSGDLLAGMIVSLIAQGMNPFDASCACVYIHGDCADKLSAKISERSMLVSDLIKYLPKYMKRFG